MPTYSVLPWLISGVSTTHPHSSTNHSLVGNLQCPHDAFLSCMRGRLPAAGGGDLDAALERITHVDARLMRCCDSTLRRAVYFYGDT